MAHRRMLVVAGPPGSGKTTFFPVTELGVDCASARFRDTDAFRRDELDCRKRRARCPTGAGRRSRASERDIRAIHEASVQNLGKALPVFDVVRIYDSTAPWTAPRLVATARSAQVVRHGESPAWLDRALWALPAK